MTHYRRRKRVDTGLRHTNGRQPRWASPPLFLRDAGPLIYGTLTSQPDAAETPAQKIALARQTGAQAVDMETKSAAELCAEFGVPMLSIRAISDLATQSLPVPFPVWFDAVKQRPRAGSLVKYLASHPAAISDFVRFVSGITKARAELTRYLLRLLPKL